MATVFTHIINGTLPARFVWKDEQCVAFLSNRPLKIGHTLVVCRKEVDHWLDLEADLAKHLMAVAQSLGKALQQGFQPLKVGLMIAGLEVPHVHLHLVPIQTVHDLDFANQNFDPDPADMDRAAATIRATLRTLGSAQVAEE